jgi:5-methylcytosine-specific restriction endonuclease McrA
VAAKQCSRCGETKPLDQFGLSYRKVIRSRTSGRRSQCRECVSRHRANRWKSDSEFRQRAIAKVVATNIARVIRLRNTDDGRDHLRTIKRRYQRKLVQRGMTVNGKPRKRPFRETSINCKDGYESLAASNARQAWAFWIKGKAPAWWMREAYRDKPWTNPRISKAQSWRIRYWCDPSFRAAQIEKVQRTKVKRRAQIDATDDGTLQGHVIVALFAAAKTCAYCGRTMRSVEKSLDHVVPLHRGGAHSITNVVVACKPCNFSKHTRTVEEWRGLAA